MPLNINDNDTPRKKEKETPQPITHTPKEGNPYFTKVTVSIFILTAVVAGLFLLYEYNILQLPSLSNKTDSAQMSQSTQEQRRGSDNLKYEPLHSAGNEIVNANDTVSDTGKFVVYIGAYRNRSDAEEEVGRWIAAGFKSFVDDRDSWHRVTFGRYASLNDAKADAEHWKQAFEYGYWISRVQ